MTSVIQKTIASVGAAIVVRRICCVPSAQTAAATSMPMRGERPAGDGRELVPEQERDAERGRDDAGDAGAAAGARRRAATPQSAEKIGIV